MDAIVHWELPGTFVNEKPYSYCQAYYDKNGLLLNHIYSQDGLLSTHCWYSDATTNSATVMMTLFFSNGAIVPETASGQFKVYKPSFETPLQIIKSGQNALYAAPIPGLTALGLQPSSPPAPPTGSPVAYNCYLYTMFSGTVQITQLINGSTSGALENLTTGGTNELDVQYPYQNISVVVAARRHGTQPPPPQLSYQDMPWVTCSNSPTIINWSFTDYLQFQPSVGSQSENIFVTLGTITWSDFGKANESGGVWSVDSSSIVSPPIGPVMSNVFPYWQNVMNPP
jgi:hypothetical protein